MKTILVDAVDTLINEDGSIFQDMFNLLETYPNKKIILTNADDKQFEKHKLKDAPYEVFTLKHDPEKTNPSYFEKMLKHFYLSIYEVIYFEHNPDAVKSAQSVGITSYYYDKDKRDLDALKEFLDGNM